MEYYFINKYDVQELVEAIKHPVVNTGPKMFKFLRATGVLNGMTPNAVLKSRGILWDETRDVAQGRRTRSFQKVLFSDEGRKWVIGLLNHYYGEGDPSEIPRKRSKSRNSWDPFAVQYRR